MRQTENPIGIRYRIPVDLQRCTVRHNQSLVSNNANEGTDARTECGRKPILVRAKLQTVAGRNLRHPARCEFGKSVFVRRARIRPNVLADAAASVLDSLRRLSSARYHNIIIVAGT